MNISYLVLTDEQWETTRLLAEEEAIRQKHPKPLSAETPQNIIRLALGLEPRKRGGWRERKAKQPDDCKR